MRAQRNAQTRCESDSLIIQVSCVESCLGPNCDPRDAQLEGPDLRGFQGHFDGALQDSSREGGAGHGGKPQAEVLMAGVRADGFHNALQAGHPADSQVAVLQANPLPLLHAGYEHLLSLHQHN